MSATPYFLLIDGHALIYRAYHAFPGLSTHEGLLVNAVYGFTRIILTSIRDFHPEYIAVAFDLPQPTFRHQAFADYKATRVKMPDDLIPQIALVKEMTQVLNIPQFELAGFEADDLIGTLSQQAKVERVDGLSLMTVIVTGDRDAFQLVDDDTHVWMPGRGKNAIDLEYEREAVKLKMGVYPEQIVDLKALMGDASDNIPGVAGVGEKTAVKLIQEFESLDGVYQELEKVLADSDTPHPLLKGALVQKLTTGREQAYLSQSLATINREAPIKLDLESCLVSGYDKDKACELFSKLDFKSLITLLPADEFELGVQSALF